MYTLENKLICYYHHRIRIPIKRLYVAPNDRRLSLINQNDRILSIIIQNGRLF